MLSLATLLLIATGGCSYTLINHDTDTYTSAADALIDLSVDFNETVNVLDEDNYSDSLSLLRDRADYWSGQLSVITEVDTSSNKNAFKKCGGICPWLDDGNEVEMKTVDQMYSTSNAPNIVFVLIDDWGWNDAGYTSTYLSWTTPHIDKIAKEGVKLTNYYASFLCNPARSSLMTGRYPIRTGTWKPQNLDSELPLDETTLAEEMKSAGYRTYMVGKWHLGYSATGHLPTYRGFDEFYGFYGGDMDYWTKSREDGLIDLQDNNGLVTDTDALSADLHSGYLFETKAEDYIADHATNYADEPLFMYYAMQLVHAPWAAPDRFLSRCEMPEEALTDTVANDIYTFCAMNVMLDEAIANLTCALNANGMADNTVLIVASDNGGEVTISGNSYPYRGNKGSYWNGGIKANAFIHSPLLSEDVRGTSYSGLMHITGIYCLSSVKYINNVYSV
jgi:arylsulfatase B/arylsulfatase I/J